MEHYKKNLQAKIKNILSVRLQKTNLSKTRPMVFDRLYSNLKPQFLISDQDIIVYNLFLFFQSDELYDDPE